MSDLEREEIFLQISETLDNVDEIIDENDIDTETDEQFAEIKELLVQLRSIVTKE